MSDPTTPASVSDDPSVLTETSAAESDASQAKKPYKAPGLLRSAGLIALVTILSKLLGAVRDWQIATVYGLTVPSEAYFAAQQLPSFSIILLGGLGGPFHTATVAIFSKLIKDNEPPNDKARKLASAFVTMTAALFAVLALLCFVFAEPIMQAILGQGKPEVIAQSAIQLQIMAPVVLIGSIVGIFYGLLNVYHSFIWPSLSPAVLSVVMILALLIFPKDPTGQLLAWSTLAGSALQLLLQVPDMIKHRFSLKPRWDWESAEIRQLGEILFPAMIGTTIGQLTVYVDMFFTSGLPVGSWAAIVLGNRLIQLPIGVLQTAFLVPIFPMFTRFVADKNYDALKSNFCSGVVSLWLVSIPILILSLFFTEDIVRLVFQHGQFTDRDTLIVSQAFVFLAFSMLPYFARDSITRIFYAFHDAKTPLIVGVIAIGTKALLDWLLVKPLGVGGITGSTTLVTLINMTLLGILSKRHVPDLGFRNLLNPFLKLMASGFFMVAIIQLIQIALPAARQDMIPFLSAFTFSPLVALWFQIFVCATGGLFIFIVSAMAFRIPEAEYVVNKGVALVKRVLPLRFSG